MNGSLSEVLASLPAVSDVSRLAEIRAALSRLDRTIVVLDDDPTGTQTVADVPVLTTWSVEAFVEAMAAREPTLFVLTNSRSLDEEAAERLAREIGENLVAASRETGREFLVVSRSDSTLRGHYPAEVASLAEAVGLAGSPHILVPYFQEGGRYTIGDTHYVADEETLVPAAETPFAQDAAFGYKSSDLREWTREKFAASGRQPGEVTSVSIEQLRTLDSEALASLLAGLSDDSVCVINAADPADVEAFVEAALLAEASGRQFLYRTAAGVVRPLAGQSAHPLLTSEQIVDPEVASGLIVVGSYVPKTTRQLDRLIEQSRSGDLRLEEVPFDVSAILGGSAEEEVERVVSEAESHLANGSHVVIATSRDLVTGSDATSSLEIGQAVSSALVSAVQAIRSPLRFLIAKGGITSSDVAVHALQIRRAQVAGQILPGVPVWTAGAESSRPGLSYVIFPGNVGSDDALFEAFQTLAE